MAIDLTGGLSPSVDYPQLDGAADLRIGENQAFWVFDETGRFALLLCHIQAGPHQAFGEVRGNSGIFSRWEERRLVFGLADTAGPLMTDYAAGPGTTPEGFELGGWTFRCKEPFRRWTAAYRGAPRITSFEEQTRDTPISRQGDRLAVEIDLELTMLCPPWIQGDFIDEHAPGRDEGLLFIGVPRYEQLCRAAGRIRIDGQEYPFNGIGLRTHRYGRREGATNTGHCWATAMFPSGGAFGAQEYDGADRRNIVLSEAFVKPAGQLLGAQILDAPRLTRVDTIGETFALRLGTPSGETEIQGEVVAAIYNWGFGAARMPGGRPMCHSMARFDWDGEESFGLLERSAMFDRIEG